MALARCGIRAWMDCGPTGAGDRSSSIAAPAQNDGTARHTSNRSHRCTSGLGRHDRLGRVGPMVGAPGRPALRAQLLGPAGRASLLAFLHRHQPQRRLWRRGRADALPPPRHLCRFRQSTGQLASPPWRFLHRRPCLDAYHSLRRSAVDAGFRPSSRYRDRARAFNLGERIRTVHDRPVRQWRRALLECGRPGSGPAQRLAGGDRH